MPQIAPASVVTPFEYSYLVCTMVVGFTFFGEVPEGATLLDAGLVVSAGIDIAPREAQLARAAREPGRCAA
jgi:drug/metabolite transporter (DMT)-like permease